MRFVLYVIFIFVSVCGNAQNIYTVCGNGASGLLGDGGPATSASIHTPHYLVCDASGNLYYSDYTGCKVRKIDASGVITTIAGTGIVGYGGDGGAAISAKLKYPEGLAIDQDGNLYIADCQNFRIRKVDVATGIITTVAGSGIMGDDGDGGSALTSKFFPKDIHFDKNGNLYISDNNSSKVRKINSAGIISTIAGNGICTFSGDGTPATAASLCDPTHLTIDDTGNIYIADALNKRIRKIDTFGVISTIAGTGVALYSGDGFPAISSNVGPLGVVFYNNMLYVTDSNQRIRKIGASGIIETIAGTGIPGYGGDGFPAITAQFNMLSSITVDKCGNVYVGDILNHRIRKVVLNPFTTPSITVTGIATASAGSVVTVNATVTGTSGAYTIKWFRNSSLFSTTTVPTATYTKGAGTDTITARIVPENTQCSDSATSVKHLVSVASVSVHNVVPDFVVGIFPNPAHNELYIQGAVSYYRILDIVGTVVQQGLVQGSAISVSALPSGMYLLEATGAEGQRAVMRFRRQ